MNTYGEKIGRLTYARLTKGFTYARYFVKYTIFTKLLSVLKVRCRSQKLGDGSNGDRSSSTPSGVGERKKSSQKK